MGEVYRGSAPRDIDILFELPDSVYHRFQSRLGNRQSQLLQEIKYVVGQKYPSTSIRGHGPVVVIPFTTFKIELAPAFRSGTGNLIPITTGTGSCKSFYPNAEISHVSDSDRSSGGKTRHLIRMMKSWQRVCNVDIKSFWIELLAVNFLSTWAYRTNTMIYYDYMVRDFFDYIRQRTTSYVSVPGTSETLYLGSRIWRSKAQSAYERAAKACGYEAANNLYEAGVEWQKIFGDDIPIWV